MPMPDWYRYSVLTFGLLFFVGHFVWMLISLRYATSLNQLLEYIGKCVPGIGGLLIGLSPFAPSALLGFAMSLAGLPVIFVGRALYELIVFRK